MNIDKSIKSIQYAFHLGIFLLWLYAFYGLYNWEIHPWLNAFILTSLGMITVGMSYFIRRKTTFIRLLFLVALMAQLVFSSFIIYDKNLLVERWQFLLALAIPAALIIQLHELLKIDHVKLKVGLILYALQLLFLIFFIFSPIAILRFVLYIMFVGIYLFARLNTQNKQV
jgi:hypothetical protein